MGKTTCAAAMGIAAARTGARTLIVSTDPAPSLGDALRQRLGSRPRAVRGVPGLHAVEVDASAALDAWIASRRELLEEVALRGTWLDRDDVTQLLRLSLPGIDEIAGLLQIAEYTASGAYERIIVDTAPTGHMLRMLSMPSVLGGLAQVFDRMQGKHRIMVEALRGGWTPDAADVLIASIDQEARRMDRLVRRHETSRMTWITLPEPMAIAETSDALRALQAQGVAVDRIIVNRITAAPPSPCRWCSGRRRAEQRAVASLRLIDRDSPAATRAPVLVPATAAEPRGIRLLERIGRIIERPSRRVMARSGPAARNRVAATLPPLKALDAWSVLTATTRLVMFGGKGGVGKTTCAAAIALQAASARSLPRVLLLSADPAHSLADVFGVPLSDDGQAVRGGPANMIVRELDARRGFDALRERFAGAIEEFFARVAGRSLPAPGSSHDRQVLQDLLALAPPGVDELVAIIEVTDALLSSDADGGFDLVVIDTAPTGHALRLIEMPALVHQWVKAVMGIVLKYQAVAGVGELGAVLLRLAQGLHRLRDLLGDPARTAFVVVTRAAELPRAETARLVGRLRAAAINVPLVIVNALGAGACSRCRRERRVQIEELSALRRDLAKRGGGRATLAVTPGWIPAPAGVPDLRAFAAEWREVTPLSR